MKGSQDLEEKNLALLIEEDPAESSEEEKTSSAFNFMKT